MTSLVPELVVVIIFYLVYIQFVKLLPFFYLCFLCYSQVVRDDILGDYSLLFYIYCVHY